MQDAGTETKTLLDNLTVRASPFSKELESLLQIFPKDLFLFLHEVEENNTLCRTGKNL